MSRFQSVSILLPTLNETFSFIQTVEIILQECDHKDIKEFIAIVCERTESASLNAIETAKKNFRAKWDSSSYSLSNKSFCWRGCARRNGLCNWESYHYDGTRSGN